jgi:hypothetical protein
LAPFDESLCPEAGFDDCCPEGDILESLDGELEELGALDDGGDVCDEEFEGGDGVCAWVAAAIIIKQALPTAAATVEVFMVSPA